MKISQASAEKFSFAASGYAANLWRKTFSTNTRELCCNRSSHMTAIHSQVPHAGGRRVWQRPRRASGLVKRALAAVRDWRRRRRDGLQIAALDARISRDETGRGDPLDLDLAREQKERDAWLERPESARRRQRALSRSDPRSRSSRAFGDDGFPLLTRPSLTRNIDPRWPAPLGGLSPQLVPHSSRPAFSAGLSGECGNSRQGARQKENSHS